MPDIQRDPAILRRKRGRRAAVAVVCAVAAIAGFVAVARMAPAAPGVDRATVVIDTVRRAPFVREVRGIGTLVPEDSRWLAATTEGRVERIRLRPGAAVVADSIILELTNPQVEQESINARLAWQSAKAALESLRAQLQNDSLTQQSQVASIESEYQQARLDFEANDALAKLRLVSPLVLKQSQLRADLLLKRAEIEKARLKVADDSINARLQVQQAAVEQAEAVWDLQQRRLAALKVRAGFSGVLQQVPVEVGQSVAPGQNLARVADPGRLKAELKISETLARDVELGHVARVDTRNSIILGHVTRKDPAATNGTVTVDVTLDGALPRGAVPDLTVDGTIELERVESALQVGRPANAQEDSELTLFKLNDAGDAERVRVKVGRSSVTAIQVIDGLNANDRVVVSDMSAWDGVRRITFR